MQISTVEKLIFNKIYARKPNFTKTYAQLIHGKNI